jgi:hypothetical protein
MGEKHSVAPALRAPTGGGMLSRPYPVQGTEVGDRKAAKAWHTLGTFQCPLYSDRRVTRHVEGSERQGDER